MHGSIYIYRIETYSEIRRTKNICLETLSVKQDTSFYIHPTMHISFAKKQSLQEKILREEKINYDFRNKFLQKH